MIDDIDVSDPTQDDDRETAQRLLRKLARTNKTRGFDGENERFAITANGPGGDLIGGVAGFTKWGWMYVEALWIAEEMRGLGLGQKLMTQAEDLARVRGCGAMWLDTMSFEAKPFYDKLGFEEFGALDNYPPGHYRHFLKKSLV